jgi:xanthine dehydrogenase iron-sulfur cluster and FAD-binding subunit A
MDQKQVVTVRGLQALSPSGVHPVSRAFASMEATQCGFCTPGFVSTLTSRLALKDLPPPRRTDLERIFDGNLCRCTGYRPIMDAASIFCVDALDTPAVSVLWAPCVSAGCGEVTAWVDRAL